jgi:hypothetical protein
VAGVREQLEGNLEDLSERLKRGAYRAKPVRRVFILKSDGVMRPLGVTTLADKIVQRATVEVLNQIYEADFLGFSYGFRRRRGQHDALDALYVGIMTKKVNWVLDLDIREFFTSINHEWRVKFVEHRIADRRIVRLIQKWLRAGVLEDGERTQSEVGFEHVAEAAQFRADLAERFAKFGLELHPAKTRLLEFGRYAAERRKRNGRGKPESFEFLGFTHVCGKTRGGGWERMRRLVAAYLPAARITHPQPGVRFGLTT